jgi:hypothetical protein
VAHGIYKFLDKEHLPSILEKVSLKFGRLKYYRLLEAVTGNQWIGDLNEGVCVTESGKIEISPESPNLEAKQALAKARIAHVNESTTLIMEEAKFISQVDCFVLSLAAGDLDTLVQAMCSQGHGNFGYDGCIEIPDLSQLEQLIRSNGKLSDGSCVSELFAIEVDKVRYEALTPHDFQSSLAIPPGDPFRKSEIYSTQCEVRVVLYPKERMEIDHVFVSVDFPPKFLIERPLNLPITPESKLARKQQMTEEERKQHEKLYLEKICHHLDAWCETRRSTRNIDFGEGWHERALESRALDEAEFSKYRKAITLAFWEVRRLDHSHFVDDAILGPSSATMFVSRICLFLCKAGVPRSPC